MSPSVRLAVLLLVISTTGSGLSSGWATEIVLKRSAVVGDSIVRLSDVADVIDSDVLSAESIGAVVLGPAPLRTSVLSIDVVRERLLSSGLATGSLEFTGSTRCAVTRERKATAPKPLTHVPRSTLDDVKRRLADALAERADLAFPGEGPFRVSVGIEEQAAHVVSNWTGPFAFRGGSSDLGEPQFLELIGPASVRFVARFERSPRVAVAAMPLTRGTILQASHLKYEARDQPGVSDVAQLVGQQIVHGLAAGKAVQSRDVRKVKLVRVNEIVTVGVSVPGITVRRQMKSKSDGALGEMITCASLDGRKTLVARVTGPNTAEIVAGPSAAATALSDPQGAIRFSGGNAAQPGGASR